MRFFTFSSFLIQYKYRYLVTMKRLIVLFLGFLSYISLNAQDYVTVSSLLFENQYYTITLTNNRINNYDLYVEYFFTYNGERIGTIHRANIPSGKKSCTEMLVGYTEKQNAWMSKIPRGEENNVGITILFVGKREGKLYTSTGSGNGIRHTTNNSYRNEQISMRDKGNNQARSSNELVGSKWMHINKYGQLSCIITFVSENKVHIKNLIRYSNSSNAPIHVQEIDNTYTYDQLNKRGIKYETNGNSMSFVYSNNSLIFTGTYNDGRPARMEFYPYFDK